MSTNNKDQLITKYLDGDTSLEEEAVLFEEVSTGTGLKAWAQYRSKVRTSTPGGLTNRIDAAMGYQRPRQRTLKWTIAAIAASLVMFLVFYINSSKPSSMSLEEKQAILEEVLNSLPEEGTSITTDNIIYEDEMIVIYLENE